MYGVHIIVGDFSNVFALLFVVKSCNKPQQWRKSSSKGFKGGETCASMKYQFWRQDNYPIELSSNSLMEQKLEYIHENPLKAGIVLSGEEFLYSSAKSYAGLGEYLLEVMPNRINSSIGYVKHKSRLPKFPGRKTCAIAG